MTDFFNDLTGTAWFNAIAEIIKTITSDYLLETAGVLFFILVVLISVRLLKKRRGRKKRVTIEEVETGRDEQATIGDSSQVLPEIDDEPHVDAAPVVPVSVMGRLKGGLQKTRRSLAGRIESALSQGGIADSNTIEEIEEALITSDVGVNTTMALIQKLQENASTFTSPDDFRSFLKSEMLGFLTPPKQMDTSVKPCVIMVVGVNGAGKTTTIGKLAHRYQSEGKKVLIGAADTFRAAAVEQLEIWAERSGADIVKHRDNADPAAVAFDAVEAGLSRGSDIVIIDTAGRLQTKVNLMEQLKKIKRGITKKMPGAPHEVFLVLDGTTGQNAISQAKIFHEGIGVTSLVLTKLDGTAKGGIVISICNTMNLPLQYIGVGEGIEDLQPFDPKKFIDAIF